MPSCSSWTLHGDLFVQLGVHLFRGLAVILIAWFGIQSALAASEGRGPFPMAKFASLLMTIAFGYAMITYYARPIPGFGVSFTHLITDQAHALATQLEASQAQEIDARLTEVYAGMEQPSILNTLDLLRYVLIVFTLTGARAALLAVIGLRVGGYRSRRGLSARSSSRSSSCRTWSGCSGGG